MKSESPSKIDTPEVRTLKSGTCPTLSGKSTLTYLIGSNDKSDVLIRVEKNDGGGYFNKEWIPLSAIQEMLKKHPDITSFTLRPLYSGKSTNSPGFLLAVLKAEGLVQLRGEKERAYMAIDSDKFMAEVKGLMESKPEKPNKKAAAKPESSPLET